MEELEVSSAYFFGQSSLVLPDGLGLLSELRTQEEGGRRVENPSGVSVDVAPLFASEEHHTVP